MPEMIVPKSSHDQFCSKKSYPNAGSTITISESAQCVWYERCIPLPQMLPMHRLNPNVFILVVQDHSAFANADNHQQHLIVGIVLHHNWSETGWIAPRHSHSPHALPLTHKSAPHLWHTVEYIHQVASEFCNNVLAGESHDYMNIYIVLSVPWTMADNFMYKTKRRQ